MTKNLSLLIKDLSYFIYLIAAFIFFVPSNLVLAESVDSYTKLLIHADGIGNSFLDSSLIPRSITANGDVTQSSTQSKFGGKSAYLDGTGDYLSLDDSSDWTFSGNFTIEAWYRATAHPGRQTIIGHINGGAWSNIGWVITQESDGSIMFQASNSGGTGVTVVSSNTLTNNTWYHIAVVRNGNVFKLYIDGIEKGTETSAITINNLATTLKIGTGYTADYVNGYLDEVRVSNIARWTSAFTPPASAYSGKKIIIKPQSSSEASDNDSYDKLLLHAGGIGTSFTDSSLYHKSITANGNATQSSTQSKFGGKSAYFDGTGDYLSVPDSEDFDFGSGNFTIDWWEYRTNAGAFRSSLQRINTFYTPYVLGYSNGAGSLTLYASSDGANWNIASAVSMGSISLNEWVHLAVVRSGNNFYTFKNGIQQATWVSGLAFQNVSGPLEIGRWIQAYASDFSGYIDELRISKGIARWTSNFTPPNSAYGSIKTTISSLLGKLKIIFR